MNPARNAAAERNRQPILDVLEQVLPATADVLEIAAGTGLHAAHAGAAHPAWTWQPTDALPAALPIAAETTRGLPNVRAPVRLDVRETPWPVPPRAFDALLCINMLHISPWATCAALMHGAATHLRPGGTLLLYGPYRVEGEPLVASNAAFDADLKARDPEWGLRELGAVIGEAERAGLAFERRWDMPANNLMLAFRGR